MALPRGHSLGIFIFSFGVSCSNSSGSGGTGVPDVGNMKATVDGESWEAQGANAFSSSTTVDRQNVEVWSATGALKSDTSLPNNEILSVEVFSAKGATSISTDTYSVGEDSYPGALIIFNKKVDGVDTQYVSESGEVTVESVSEDGFAGTFSGTVVNSNDPSDTMEISDGGFNVEFPSF